MAWTTTTNGDEAQLHASDVQSLLTGATLDTAEITRLLDQLDAYQVLDRSYDGARAEYRNRHYVYQFTEAGYRAYRAVEDVLGASTRRHGVVPPGAA